MKYLRSMLVMPGNNPAMLLKSASFGADALIFDLEDAVAPSEKDAARRLVAEHVRSLDYSETQIVVRVNDINTEIGRKDLEVVSALGITAVTVPKIENAGMVRKAEEIIDRYERKDLPPVLISPVIETALGVLHAEEIAFASPRVFDLTLGAADYATSVGARRRSDGREIQFARDMVVNACAAAGILATDTPYLDLDNEEGLREDAAYARDLGFDGKICINPRQLKVVHEVFSPSAEEIRHAQRLVEAMEEHKAQGTGVFALDGRMVDRPMIVRAEQVLALAEAIGVKL